MPHTCHAINCETVVPRKMFMCRKHWGMVPKKLRDAIWREYVPGQESRMNPTQAYLDVTKEARQAVRAKEMAQ